MSKCKAVLDSEKITEIWVKVKAQERPQKDTPEFTNFDEPKWVCAATQQSE